MSYKLIDKTSLFIFDWDGVIIDSKQACFLTLKKTLEKRIDLTWEKFCYYNNSHKDFFSELGLGNKEKLEFDLSFRENCKKNAKFINGSIEAIKELRGLGKKVAIATNCTHSSIIDMTRHFDVFNLFDMVIGKSFNASVNLAIKPKPYPDMIEYIIKKSEIKPKNTVMIGDSKTDIIAGKKAKTKTVGVLSGYTDGIELKHEKPDFIFDNIFNMIK
jgi:HAD superfamily hydrolase (TIGR01662 family)